MQNTVVASAILMSALSGQAQANENIFTGMYVGGTLGQYSATSELASGPSLSESDDELGLSFQLGYAKSFGRWGIGLEYQRNGRMGDAEGDLSVVYINQAWSVSLLPEIRVSEDFLMYGRVGKGSAETEVSPFWSDDYIDQIDFTVYGIEGKYKVMPNVSISTEYKVLNGSNDSVDIESKAIEFGAQYIF